MRSLLKLIFGAYLLVAVPPNLHAQKGAPADALRKRYEKANLLPVYDAARDETSVYMLAMSLTGSAPDNLVTAALLAGSGVPTVGVRFTIYFTYPGKTFAAPRRVVLRLASTNRDGPRFAGAGEVTLTADGEARSFGGAEVTSRRYTSDIPKRGAAYVDEMLEVSLPVEELRRLAAAKKVELKAGGASLAMKDGHLKSIRRLADVVGGAN